MTKGHSNRPQKRRSRETAADRAANTLRRRMLSGELAPGSTLPGERELSEQMGVSRLTLRTALTRLEAEGLVRSSHGAATRVLDYRERGGLALLPELARVELESGRVPANLLRDMLEVRRVVAVEALGLVTERLTDDDIARLRLRLEALEEAVGDAETFMRRDVGFAREIVQSTRNVAMELLYNSIERLLLDQDFLRPTFLANAEGTVKAYRRLMVVMETRDAACVRRAARTLLEELDAETLARLGEVIGIDVVGSPRGARTRRPE